MAPRWKRGGPKGLCGFESRSLRFYYLESRISNLRFEFQAPDSVQSRTREPLQDRKVAKVAGFRCAAESPEPVPFWNLFLSGLATIQYRAHKQPSFTRLLAYERGTVSNDCICAWYCTVTEAICSPLCTWPSALWPQL